MQCSPPLASANYLRRERERNKHKIAFFLNKMRIFWWKPLHNVDVVVELIIGSDTEIIAYLHGNENFTQVISLKYSQGVCTSASSYKCLYGAKQHGDSERLVYYQLGMRWEVYKQGKVSDCDEHGDLQNDPCLALFKLTRDLHVASPGWHISTRQMLTNEGYKIRLEVYYLKKIQCKLINKPL